MFTSKTFAGLATAVIATGTMSLTIACSAAPIAPGDDHVGQTGQALTVLADPNSVCVTSHNASNSGTSDSLTLGYWEVNSGLYECTLAGGVGTGKTECCTPSKVSDDSSRATALAAAEIWQAFTIRYTSTSDDGDGLLVTEMEASNNSNSTSAGSFTSLLYGGTCDSCTLGTGCGACWIDGSGHGNVNDAVIVMSARSLVGDNYFMSQDKL